MDKMNATNKNITLEVDRVDITYTTTQIYINNRSTHSEVLENMHNEDGGDTARWIAGCVAFVVVVFLLATLQWYRKNKIVPGSKKRARLKKIMKNKAVTNRIIKALSMEPIKREEFISKFKTKIYDKVLPCELKAIQRFCESHECSSALQPHNSSKNLSSQFLPYEHSRVCLPCTNGDVTSDYINASYIYKSSTDNSYNSRTYIAAQSPLYSTVDDFWRMVWEERCAVIVMLNAVVHYSQMEWVKYWHDTYALCGGIHVQLDSTTKTLHYTIRNFIISKTGSDECRLVQQFNLHGWLMEAIPDAAGLLQLRRRLKAATATLTSPILVHCSTGSERTGAYIALDLVLDKLERDGVVDILRAIVDIRRYRPRLVSTATLLDVIYTTIYFHILCGSSVIPIKSAESDELFPKSAEVEREYKLFDETTRQLEVGDCAAGHMIENKDKSRDIMVQPPDRARPHLMIFDATEHSDFINAVYVDGYQEAGQYIVGEWPLKHSVNDFWRLILDKQITSCAVLHSLPGSIRKYPIFWPLTKNQSERFGPVRVTMIDSTDSRDFSMRTFDVQKFLLKDKSSITLRIIFIKHHWYEDASVESHYLYLTKLIQMNQQWSETHDTSNTPTFVMSRDGVDRAGLYCALAICTDQINKDVEVDVFNAVRIVKHNRPGLVNKKEYLFLYKVVEGLVRKKFSTLFPATDLQNTTSGNTPKNGQTGASDDHELRVISENKGHLSNKALAAFRHPPIGQEVGESAATDNSSYGRFFQTTANEIEMTEREDQV